MKFHKTIRFQLTLWYSLLLLALSSIFILFVNIIVTNYYNQDLRNNPGYMRTKIHIIEKQREAIHEIRQEDLRQIRVLSFYSLLPLAILSFGGGYVIAGYMLSPIRKLNKAAQEIHAQNLHKIIKHEDTGDDMSELVNSFNQMTARLENSFRSQKEFVENASHELKTPLAIIRTNLDLALSDDKINQKEIQNLIKTAKNSGEFMNKLIEDLLLLSILENNITKESENLQSILKESISAVSSLAKKKKIVITANISATPYKMEVNKVLMKRAFMNVLENAIKYSPKGSKIKVSMKTKNSKPIIRIVDQGPGIPKSEHDKIFNRFYRIDKSRSKKSGGTGLGLAITKKILGVHGMGIEVTTDKYTTFLFRIL